MMRNKINVLQSRFLLSVESFCQAPAILHTEIAILGRSNVGKSSLINAMLNHKNLAKSSSTPGKTKLINFFLSHWQIKNENQTNDFEMRFIDFPGFGYAKVSKEQKKAWDKNLSLFLQKRDSIKLYIHLIDSRHLDLTLDKEIRDFLSYISRQDSMILEVFTKIDKLNKKDFLALKRVGKIGVSCADKQSIACLREEILHLLYGVKFV